MSNQHSWHVFRKRKTEHFKCRISAESECWRYTSIWMAPKLAGIDKRHKIPILISWLISKHDCFHPSVILICIRLSTRESLTSFRRGWKWGVYSDRGFMASGEIVLQRAVYVTSHVFIQSLPGEERVRFITELCPRFSRDTSYSSEMIFVLLLLCFFSSSSCLHFSDLWENIRADEVNAFIYDIERCTDTKCLY